MNQVLHKVNLKIPRPFLPLLPPRRFKGAYGGRGSSKSHHFAEKAVEWCVANPGTRGVCLREVQKSLMESAKLLIADKIQHFGLGPLFEVQRDVIRTPGGGIIVFQGMKDHTAESIKSLEGFHWAWFEEAQTASERSLELLKPTIRMPGSELWFSWNPRHPTDPVDHMFRCPEAQDDPDMVSVKVNFDANPWFPDVLKLERERDKRLNPTRYAHIWLGEYEPMAVGALWTRQVFHDYRWPDPPDELERIVVGVDPAVSNESGSNEHGIIVCGLDAAKRAYVLDDFSGPGTPHQWASRVIAALDKWEADGIVVEVNQGGDMVANTIKTVRPNARIIEVRATRGKHVRAAPIASEYICGKVSHVGVFAELETQLCQITDGGYMGPGSPDRADALVWALTELFPRMTTRTPLKRGMTARNEWNVFGG